MDQLGPEARSEAGTEMEEEKESRCPRSWSRTVAIVIRSPPAARSAGEQSRFVNSRRRRWLGEWSQVRHGGSDVVVQAARQRWCGDVVGGVDEHGGRPPFGQPGGDHRKPRLAAGARLGRFVAADKP